MEDLQGLFEAYEEVIGQRPSTETWFIKRYPDAFVVCQFDGISRLEVKHQRQQSTNTIELVCLAQSGEPREILHATRLTGPLRVAVDQTGCLCLRSTYRDEWGPTGRLAFADIILEASIRLTRETTFRSATSSEPPLEMRMATTLTESSTLDVSPPPHLVDAWLQKLGIRFLREGPGEWQIQTFGPSGVGYMSRLNLFEKGLMVLSYGSPNDQLVIADEFVLAMLRANDRSGICKLALVTYSGTDREAPAATIEWPAGAVSGPEALDRMVTDMTGYLEHLWVTLPSFFVPN